MAANSQAGKRRHVLAVCGGLLLAVGLVFGRTLRQEFINIDDDVCVYENAQVTRGLSVEGIVWAFTSRQNGSWDPLTRISHILDWQLYHENAWGHHLTNLVLHAATAVLLFLVLRWMTGALWPSALVAAVFAVHPLQVESVAWVTARKDVLSGLFFVLALGAYVGFVRHCSLPAPMGRLRRIVWYLAVMVFFTLGMMAKPMLVTLPFVLLLLDYWPLGRVAATHSGQRAFPIPPRLIIEKLPLLALAAVFVAVTFWAQEEALEGKEGLSLWWRIGNAPISYVFYLGKLFCPVDLTVLYPRLGLDLPLWKVFGSFLAVAGITTAALVWRRKCPYLLVGWFWYLGMLLPVIGLVQFGVQAVADRFTYLPQIGLEMALVWGVADLSRSWPYPRWAYGIGSAVVLAVLATCAWHQTSYWRDSETLMRHALECTDRNSLAHCNLGIALAAQGRLEKAMEQYQKALAIRPDFAEAHNNLGHALAACGRLDEAMVHYQKALAVRPDDAEAHDNLGIALAAGGRWDEAVAHYQRALDIRPDDAEAHNNLGIALAAGGRLDDAMAQYQMALDIRPDFAKAHYNLGIALALGGRLDKAVAHFRKALEIRPDFVEAHNNLGYVLALGGRLDEAMAQYRKALEIRPDFAEAMNHLARLLAVCPEASLRNGAEAVELAQRVNQLTGGRQPEVLDTLAAAYAEAGRFPEALATARKALELAGQQNKQALADALRTRIILYEAGKPFRQTPSGSASTPPNP